MSERRTVRRERDRQDSLGFVLQRVLSNSPKLLRGSRRVKQKREQDTKTQKDVTSIEF